MFKNGAFFGSRMSQNRSKTEKGEKPIRAYPPMKNHVLEGGRLSKPPPKGVKNVCRFSVRCFTTFEPLWGSTLDPKCSQNELKSSPLGALGRPLVPFSKPFGPLVPPLGPPEAPQGGTGAPQGATQVPKSPPGSHFRVICGHFGPKITNI